MNRFPPRASARLVALHLVGLSAVLTLSAAAIPHSAPRSVNLVPDVSRGQQEAIHAAQIEAAVEASWDFRGPATKLVAPVVPRTVRHVAPRSTVASSSASLPASVAGSAVLEEAAKYVGTPYKSAGTTPAGFDCTGFVAYVYAKFGVKLPRSSSAYWNIGTRVSAADARPGDLIVSSGHVGIYAGGNMQIDSPRPGKTIQFRGIWQKSYIFVRVT